MFPVYGRPLLLFLSCVSALVIALLYDGVADLVALALLLLPLFEVARHLLRSNKETRTES